MKRGLLIVISILYAVNSLANENWLNQMIAMKNQKSAIHLEPKQFNNEFFKQHVVVIFYASHCSHCHEFAPLIKKWAKGQSAEVIPLSFDNQPLPEFPNFKPATTEWVNAAFAGKAINYPALFILNKETQILYPVAIGSMTSSELDLRMKSLIPKIKAYEGKRVFS